MSRYESLHNHTTASDGTQDYLDVLKTAERNGYGIIAFTDHDVLPNEADLARLRAYKGPVKWLIGCEVSSGLPKELGDGPSSSVHIVGLFTDLSNKALAAHCVKAVAARKERMEKIVANLKELGFTISVADCLNAAGGESVGRPHIVRALATHPENAAITESIRAEMEQAAIADPAVAMEYARMIERPPGDYPYRLFLSEDAFRPMVYVQYLYSIDMDTAVKLIRDAGGVAVMVHWYTAMKKISAEKLEELIRDGRLDGVELMGNPKNPQAIRALPILENIAKRTGCLVTFGADSHYEQDIASFVSNPSIADRTVGQTAKVIELVKPDLSWSNLGNDERN